MSRTEDGRRRTEDGRPTTERLDIAIDRAVREMLDVEPPAGLRGRVLERIESPRRGIGWMWIAAPVAAAAMVVLAVLLPSRSDLTAVAPATTVATGQHLPQPTQPAPAPTPQMRPHDEAAQAVTRPSRTRQLISAGVVPADPEFQGAQVEALAGPAPLAVERLAGPPTPSLQTLDVAPIQIRALEVNALTETPRERREE